MIQNQSTFQFYFTAIHPVSTTIFQSFGTDNTRPWRNGRSKTLTWAPARGRWARGVRDCPLRIVRGMEESTSHRLLLPTLGLVLSTKYRKFTEYYISRRPLERAFFFHIKKLIKTICWTSIQTHRVHLKLGHLSAKLSANQIVCWNPCSKSGKKWSNQHGVITRRIVIFSSVSSNEMQ